MGAPGVSLTVSSCMPEKSLLVLLYKHTAGNVCKFSKVNLHPIVEVLLWCKYTTCFVYRAHWIPTSYTTVKLGNHSAKTCRDCGCQGFTKINLRPFRNCYKTQLQIIRHLPFRTLLRLARQFWGQYRPIWNYKVSGGKILLPCLPQSFRQVIAGENSGKKFWEERRVPDSLRIPRFFLAKPHSSLRKTLWLPTSEFNWTHCNFHIIRLCCQPLIIFFF